MFPVPGWAKTARRIIPDFLRISRELSPTWELDGIAVLDLGFLRSQGISVVLWDVDGTLMSHHARAIDPSVEGPFRELLAAPDLDHAIVSNCELERFEELGALFPEIPVLVGFDTPAGPAFRLRYRDGESLRGPGASQLSIPHAPISLRKPNPLPVMEALKALGREDRPESVVFVGDQYFTDVASANLAGIRSAKVPTLHRKSFPLPVRIGQRFEWLWVRFLRLLGLSRRPRPIRSGA